MNLIKTIEKEVGINLGPAYLITFPLSMLYTAYVGMSIWNWFLVPSIGIKPINITGTYGIDLLISLWVYNPFSYPSTAYRNKVNWYDSAITATFILVLGYIVHHFFMH